MIYIIIPIHNRLAATLECFECLAQQTYRDYQIILVDDGSTDDSSKVISAKYPQTVILHGDGNLWWTGAMAKGVDYALQRAQDSDFVLSLNNDVTFEKEYLQQLLNDSNQEHGAVVGSLCKNVLPPHEILDSGIKIQWYKYHYTQIPYSETTDIVTTVDTISGRGVLIPVSTFKSIGNFAYHALPHYGADYDFGFRVKAAHIPLVVSNRATVYLKDDLTGFIPTQKVLSYSDEWKRLFSIKSPNNLKVHLTLVWRNCPRRGIKYFDMCYLFFGNIFSLVRNTILYTLQLLHGQTKNPHS